MQQSVSIAPQLISILETIPDPEIPVVSIMDMGMVRSAQWVADEVHIAITPTYSGCPATDMIQATVIETFETKQIQAKVTLVLAPPWTTDWITPRGRKALAEYGIAPPLSPMADKQALWEDKKIVPCPQCGATDTQLISAFGATACKALFQCQSCKEPFDYFKCLT